MSIQELKRAGVLARVKATTLSLRAAAALMGVSYRQAKRLAYVAVSRGEYDARIYTDDKVKLARALGRDVSHRSALERTPEQVSRQSADRESSRSESIGHTMAVGSS